MALSDDGKRGQIGPSLRGLIYQYERNGQFVTSAWPKKRGRKATPKQKLAQEAFKGMMYAMKHTAANIQSVHRWSAKGTPMLPRDSLLAALYGNGPSIPHYSGKVIRPMANRILSSTVLDAMGWEPGSILFRGNDLWEPLLPGLDGQVLAYDADTKAPVWVNPSSGSGLPPCVWGVRGVSSWRAENIIGTAYELHDDATINAATWYTRKDAPWVFYFGIAFVDATNTVTSVPLVPELAGAGGVDYQYIRHVLSTPLTVPAGQRFIVFAQYSKTGLGASPSVVESWSYGSNIRPRFLPGNVWINTINLVVGNTFNIVSHQNPIIGIEFE